VSRRAVAGTAATAQRGCGWRGIQSCESARRCGLFCRLGLCLRCWFGRGLFHVAGLLLAANSCLTFAVMASMSTL
jgi:hypothetical protein